MKNNIVQLKPNYLRIENYRNHFEEYLDDLDAFADVTFTAAVNLATSGAWKTWNEKQLDGARMNFTNAMLLDTGDATVDEVMKLLEVLNGAIATLKHRAGIPDYQGM